MLVLVTGSSSSSNTNPEAQVSDRIFEALQLAAGSGDHCADARPAGPPELCASCPEAFGSGFRASGFRVRGFGVEGSGLQGGVLSCFERVGGLRFRAMQSSAPDPAIDGPPREPQGDSMSQTPNPKPETLGFGV